MKGHFAVSGALVILATVLACAGSAVNPQLAAVRVAETPRTPSGAPDVFDVTCSADGTVAVADRVTAASDGVHIRVRDHTGASRTYLNYSYGQPNRLRGGDSVHAGTSVRVLSLPPGPAALECSQPLDPKTRGRVLFEVEDPAEAWRIGALAKHGCPPPELSSVSWAIGPGRGTSTDSALAALVAEMQEPSTWLKAQEGYVAATRQTYVMQRNGVPWATASVTPDGRGGFMAGLEGLCGEAVANVIEHTNNRD